MQSSLGVCAIVVQHYYSVENREFFGLDRLRHFYMVLHIELSAFPIAVFLRVIFDTSNQLPREKWR